MSDDQFARLFKYTQQQFAGLREEIGNARADVQRVCDAVDAVTKTQETDTQECLVANHQLERHEDWIERAADTIKVSYDPAS